MELDFDAIVIGSGAGGASFAHACAQAGKSVLVIERGRRTAAVLESYPGGPHDERATLLDKRPYDDRIVYVNEAPARLYMGGVVGGSTSVYGALMLRPAPCDFEPGAQYGDRLDRALWQWPFSYDDLRPHYDRAEQLFKLTWHRGEQENDGYDPLHPPGDQLFGSVLPLAPINQKLIAANQRAGLKPFQLPLAIDTGKCELCDACAGFLCPHDARRSSAHVLDETAGPVRLMDNAEVDRLETNRDGSVDAVVVRDRNNQQTHRFRAQRYALAAGAIGSTALMLKSGIDGPNVGRNYMLHYSPLAVGFFPAATGADETFIKQVGFADYYLGTPRCMAKMGIVQSLPAPGPLMMAKSGLKKVPKRVLLKLRKRMLPMVGIVEDLPDPANRVTLRSDGSIGLEHRYSKFDRVRGRALTRAMRAILRRGGAWHVATKAMPSQEHVAHQCGTLRSGTDPKQAVTDPDCRVYGRENLFVVDGSVLPNSMGVGPSLTIAANALRVAAVAVQEM
ncbi:MAG: GMC family oxidoreductase [Planctomycetota bacterium]